MPAAAPPVDTRDISSSDLPTTRNPLSSAAPVTMAVPCWSSWKIRNAHALAQFLLDHEALGRLDVLQIDGAEGGFQAGAEFDQFMGIQLVDLDVEDVDPGEFLEEHGLALHHRLHGERADIAEPEHGGAV